MRARSALAALHRPGKLIAFAALLGLGGLVSSGCARSRIDDTNYPSGQSPRTIIAQPGTYDDIYVTESTVTTTTTTTTTTDGAPVGYDTLSDGSRVEVVTYVHSYPEAIETFPRVYWGGQWYYNVNGDFVFWSPTYGGWVYYWGPPGPLVTCWNGYYPWAPYSWGVGYYGAGWYWGGVSYYGYHAYGLPVANQQHHHHHYWADNGGPSKPPSQGAPSHPSSPGGPASDGPRRTRPAAVADGPRRNPVNAGATRADAAGTTRTPGDGARRNPVGDARNGGLAAPGTAPSRTKQDPAVASAAPSRLAPTAVSRDPSPAAKTGAAPVRTVPVSRDAVASGPARTPTRNNSYTTASGQRVTTIDPRRPSAAPVRSARTVGSLPAANAPARVANDPFASPATARPRWDQPAAPSRSWSSGGASHGPVTTAPARSSAPARSAGGNTPAWSAGRSNPAPSRSYSPPSRSSAPSRAASPSRSYSPPSRSYSPPSRSASPSRSYSPPSRSASPSRSYSPPSRSSGGSHSSPSRSAPSHHSSPSRSAPSRGHHR